MKKLVSLIICVVLCFSVVGCFGYDYTGWETHTIPREQVTRKIKLPKNFEIRDGEFMTIWDNSEGVSKLVATEWCYGKRIILYNKELGKCEADISSYIFNENFAPKDMDFYDKITSVSGFSNGTRVFEGEIGGKQSYLFGFDTGNNLADKYWHYIFVFEQGYDLNFIEKIAYSYG